MTNINHIETVMNRAQRLFINSQVKFDRITVLMDLQNANVNFEKLASFDEFEFSHDIAGITQNINRETGKLENCFVPRSVS